MFSKKLHHGAGYPLISVRVGVDQIPLEASVGQDVLQHLLFQGNLHLVGDFPVQGGWFQEEARCRNGQKNHRRFIFADQGDHGAQIPCRLAGIHPPEQIVSAVAENHHVWLCFGKDGGEPPESFRGNLTRHAGPDDPNLQESLQDLRVALSGTRRCRRQAVAEGQDGLSESSRGSRPDLRRSRGRKRRRIAPAPENGKSFVILAGQDTAGMAGRAWSSGTSSVNAGGGFIPLQRGGISVRKRALCFRTGV